jgi:hypothetical protein
MHIASAQTTWTFSACRIRRKPASKLEVTDHSKLEHVMVPLEAGSPQT